MATPTPAKTEKEVRKTDDEILAEMMAGELEWTQDKPKAEGYYWTMHGAELMVVKVEKQPLNRGLKVVLPAHEVRSFDLVQFKWWKGPIQSDNPPPTEYKPPRGKG